MSDRPLFDASIDQLEQMFAHYAAEPQCVEALSAELSFRKTPRAKALRKKVEVAQQILQSASMLIGIDRTTEYNFAAGETIPYGNSAYDKASINESVSAVEVVDADVLRVQTDSTIGNAPAQLIHDAPISRSDTNANVGCGLLILAGLVLFGVLCYFDKSDQYKPVYSVPYSYSNTGKTRFEKPYPPSIDHSPPKWTPFRDVQVRGYTRSDGTYVRPHYRTRDNGLTEDNYSTRGNRNPYTGARGNRSP